MRKRLQGCAATLNLRIATGTGDAMLKALIAFFLSDPDETEPEILN